MASTIERTSANLSHIVDVVNNDIVKYSISNKVLPTLQAAGELTVEYVMFGINILFGATIAIMILSIAFIALGLYDPSSAFIMSKYYNIGIFIVMSLMAAVVLSLKVTFMGFASILKDGSYELLSKP
jgi:hypothetical protein